MNSCGIFGSATFSILTVQNYSGGGRGELLCWTARRGQGNEADRLVSAGEVCWLTSRG